LNSELCTCKLGTLLLEPHYQSILLWLLLEIGSHELFAWADLEPQSFLSQPPRVATITGVSHQGMAQFILFIYWPFQLFFFSFIWGWGSNPRLVHPRRALSHQGTFLAPSHIFPFSSSSGVLGIELRSSKALTT
jgi:cytochrome c biogenesis factor